MAKYKKFKYHAAEEEDDYLDDLYDEDDNYNNPQENIQEYGKNENMNEEELKSGSFNSENKANINQKDQPKISI